MKTKLSRPDRFARRAAVARGIRMLALLLIAAGTSAGAGVAGGCQGTNHYHSVWTWGSSQYEEMVESARLTRLKRQHEQRWQQQAQFEHRREGEGLGATARTAPGTPDATVAADHEQAATGDGDLSPTTTATTTIGSGGGVRFSDAHAIRAESPAHLPATAGGRPLGLYGHAAGPWDMARLTGQGADNVGQVTFTTEGADFDPAVDPAGRYIAFASTRHRRTSDIYIQAVGGTTVRQLTHSEADDVMPTFGPDGRSIAFASNRGGNWDLWMVDVDGGRPRQLTSGPSQDIHPSFSPDGRQLIYSSFGPRSGQWELWLIDVDNPANRRHVGYGLFPRWSPEGNQVVFQKARQRGHRWFSIWTIDLVDGEARRPTEIVSSANAAAITPAWSPDGEHLVFATVLDPDSNGAEYGPQQADLWLMDRQGRHRINLTAGRFANVQPIWAADGTIYFVSNRGGSGGEAIWSLRPGDAMRLARPADDPARDRTATAPAPGSDDD